MNKEKCPSCGLEMKESDKQLKLHDGAVYPFVKCHECDIERISRYEKKVTK